MIKIFNSSYSKQKNIGNQISYKMSSSNLVYESLMNTLIEKKKNSALRY